MPALSFPLSGGGFASGSGSPYAAAVQRGMAQGMRDALTISGSGNIGAASHTFHYSPAQGFARSKVVFATTYQAGTQLQDTDLPDALFIQCALEPIAVKANASIPVRQNGYKFGGAKFATYNGPGTNSRKLLVSDWLYHPYIPPGSLNQFGLWTYVERQSGTGPLPSSDLGTSFVNRSEGFQTFATTQIGNDPALNLTSINAMNGAQLGVSLSLTPSFLIIDYGSSVKVIAIDGDSIAQYVGEGYAGSGNTSDSLGSLLRNCGYPMRGVVEQLGLCPAVNLARASDGMKFKSIIGANAGRMARLALANPTHIFSEDNINDLSGTGNVGTMASWAANQAIGYGETRVNGANIYMVNRGGITAASVGPTGTGSAIIDGQVSWKFLATGVNTDRENAIYGRTAQVMNLYRTVVPGVKICKAFTTPQGSASSNSWSNSAGQTASWTPPSIRSKLHGLYIADRTAADKTIGDTFFEIGAVTTVDGIKIEVNYDGTTANMSSLWGSKEDGTTLNYLTPDGTHFCSFGHAAGGAGFTSPMFP